MLSDYKLIKWEFDREDVTILPIGDVHIGSGGCMLDKFKQTIDNVAKSPNTYIVLVGDMMDYNLKNSIGNPFDEVIRPREQKQVLYDILKPVADKIICAVSGNHEARGAKEADNNPMYDVMCWLHKEDYYRENMAFVKLRFGTREGTAEDNPTYIMAVTHGRGAARKKGAVVNFVDDFGARLDGVDILVTGHTHNPIAFPSGKIRVDSRNETIKVSEFKCCICTSWLEYCGYGMAGMFAPAINRLQYINFCGTRKDIQILI